MLHALAERYDSGGHRYSPILAVTDAVIIENSAPNFIILNSGVHPIPEIQLTVKRYGQNNMRPKGFILKISPCNTETTADMEIPKIIRTKAVNNDGDL
jgi:hypothetical protein